MVVKAELGLFQGLDKGWNITRSNFALCFYFFEDFFRHNILRIFFFAATFQATFLGVETQCNFKACFYLRSTTGLCLVNSSTTDVY